MLKGFLIYLRFRIYQSSKSVLETTTVTRNGILPCFYAVEFENDFIIKKVELEAIGKKLAMIMNHKGLPKPQRLRFL